jgi:hypothetical protein
VLVMLSGTTGSLGAAVSVATAPGIGVPASAVGGTHGVRVGLALEAAAVGLLCGWDWAIGVDCCTPGSGPPHAARSSAPITNVNVANFLNVYSRLLRTSVCT